MIVMAPIRRIKKDLPKGISMGIAMCLSLVFNSCVEPFEGVDFITDFEDILVVNANLTNELKRQEVVLTRSFRFDEEEAQNEENAMVIVVDDQGTELLFEEVSPGHYLSEMAFAAQPDRQYTLTITTENGNNYGSTAMGLPTASTQIDALYAERIVTDDGDDGIGIFVDSFDASGSSNYYRHEFVETFKIIAPYWSPLDAVVVIEGINTFDVRAILREQEEQVCFGENRNTDILINSTVGLDEDRLERYGINFISSDNYILSHRYSILVRQYVQSAEAFSYFETLKGLSQNSGNVFSEDQPGFLQGNIFSLDDPDENVSGFFEVTTVDEQRIFFNYEDFFPGEELPPYVLDCIVYAPTTEGSFGQRELLNLIYEDAIRFYDFNFNGGIPGGGPFLVVSTPCGDCTALGSNKVPEFWVE